MYRIEKISLGGSVLSSKSFTMAAVSLLFVAHSVLGQFVDAFSDGDFTSNPAWNGHTAHFIVNPSNQLQLNNLVAATSYLAAPFVQSSLSELNWTVLVRQSFSSSASNFGRFYLVSDQQDLTGPLNGYYLQLGEAGTLDAVELFRQTGTTSVSVCRGTSAAIANAFNVRVKVSRNESGVWTLYADYSGGTNYQLESSGTDAAHNSSSFLGVRCTYTASNGNRFFFDDFSVTPFVVPDVTPPQVASVTVSSSTSLSIVFNEVVSNSSATSPGNYVLTGNITPTVASVQSDGKTVLASFANAFPNGVIQNLTVSAVSDLAGNVMSSQTEAFRYFSPVPASARDIVINEIFADPSPAVGLPEAEFVEILNRSSHPFDVSGWKITDGATTATLSSLILLPGEYLILAPSTYASLFSSYGRVMAVSGMPSLNNASDIVEIRDPTGMSVDIVNYFSSWYRDDEKDGGGFALERIDPEDFCAEGENWIASEDVAGGTPGTVNSVFSVTPDTESPRLIGYVVNSRTEIECRFSEKLGAGSASPANFVFEPVVSVVSSTFTDQTLTKVKVILAASLDSVVTYRIVASNVTDCPGNPLDQNHDELVVKLDNTPPLVSATQIVSATEIKIHFSEKIAIGTAGNRSNYLRAGNESPAQVIVAADRLSANIIFSNAFVNGVEFSLSVSNISDLAGNVMTMWAENLLFFQPVPAQRRDVIINEIFADPAPAIGLPEAEFVEILNRSVHPFDLAQWSITDGNSTGSFPSKIILPGDHVIVSASSNANLFAPFGKNVGLNIFPSLNNSTDYLILKDAAGVTVDSLKYSNSWYKDDEKKDGGWTLERIDPDDFCLEEENWAASRAGAGGTPGIINSIFESTPDVAGPRLTSHRLIGADIVELAFNEKLHVSASNAMNFSIHPFALVTAASFTDQSLKAIQLKFQNPLDSLLAYTVTAGGVTDCPGNTIDASHQTIFFQLDTIRPRVSRVQVLSKTAIEASFSEPINIASVENPVHYLINESITPLTAVALNEGRSVVLTFSEELTNGVEYSLKIFNVRDRAGTGNLIHPVTQKIMFFETRASAFKDVIISEIFADPSPTVGLPDVEYIELFNRSDKPLNLAGWILGDGTNAAHFPAKIILPAEYLIVSSSAGASQLSVFGKAVGVATFPGLNNTGEPLYLKNESGLVIDSLKYGIGWYRDEEKAEGGWSLELIYPENICAESENWTASVEPNGGTPGRRNSVFEEKIDLTGPRLMSAVAGDANTLRLTFNEKLDVNLPSTEQLVFSPELQMESILFEDDRKHSLTVELGESLRGGVRYSVNVREIFDCAGNKIEDEFRDATFALPEPAEENDIVINEVLFNPTSTGVDFIEIYNRSTRFINLNDWSIGNWVEDAFANSKKIAVESLMIAPGEFLVFTEDASLLKSEYVHADEMSIIETDLPSLPDDEGSVALRSGDSVVIDRFLYSADYHSVFLQNDEGVSLERIDYEKPSNDAQNWRSASASMGYATPGLVNSNYRHGNVVDEAVSVEPEVFIPGTGRADFSMITYKFEKSGYIANVKIYDAIGRVVKTLSSNELLSAEGTFRWDGDNDKGKSAIVGSYMIYFEIFDETGVVRLFRNRVVVAARF